MFLSRRTNHTACCGCGLWTKVWPLSHGEGTSSDCATSHCWAFGLGDCKVVIVQLPRTAQFTVGLLRAEIPPLYSCLSASVPCGADPAQSWAFCKVLNVLGTAGLVTPHWPCRGSPVWPCLTYWAEAITDYRHLFHGYNYLHEHWSSLIFLNIDQLS